MSEKVRIIGPDKLKYFLNSKSNVSSDYYKNKFNKLINFNYLFENHKNKDIQLIRENYKKSYYFVKKHLI